MESRFFKPPKDKDNWLKEFERSWAKFQGSDCYREVRKKTRVREIEVALSGISESLSKVRSWEQGWLTLDSHARASGTVEIYHGHVLQEVLLSVKQLG